MDGWDGWEAQSRIGENITGKKGSPFGGFLFVGVLHMINNNNNNSVVPMIISIIFIFFLLGLVIIISKEGRKNGRKEGRKEGRMDGSSSIPRSRRTRTSK